MLRTTFVIVHDLQDRLKIAKHFGKQSQFQLAFPRNTQEVFQLKQDCHPALIIIFLPDEKKTAAQICHRLKEDERTKEIPLLMIYNQLSADDPQIADACLGADFAEQDLDQIIRQLTMGY